MTCLREDYPIRVGHYVYLTILYKGRCAKDAIPFRIADFSEAIFNRSNGLITTT